MNNIKYIVYIDILYIRLYNIGTKIRDLYWICLE